MPLTVAGEKKLWKGGLIGAAVHLSLHGLAAASAANEFGTGATAAFRAGGYARVQMDPADFEISDLTGAAANAARIVFADPPQDGDWPPALSIGLWTAAAAGEMLVSAPIYGAPLTGTQGDPVAFEIGQLIIDV